MGGSRPPSPLCQPLSAFPQPRGPPPRFFSHCQHFPNPPYPFVSPVFIFLTFPPFAASLLSVYSRTLSSWIINVCKNKHNIIKIPHTQNLFTNAERSKDTNTYVFCINKKNKKIKMGGGGSRGRGIGHLHNLLPGWSCQRPVACLILPTAIGPIHWKCQDEFKKTNKFGQF